MWFFNHSAGSGSLFDMVLKRDLKIPFKRNPAHSIDRCELVVDERNCCYSYCIDEVYGFIPEVWNKPVRIIFEENKPLKNKMK